MTSLTECLHCDELSSAVEAAHERALAALGDADVVSFDAVAWLAAHLGAVHHVVLPRLGRLGVAPPEAFDEQRRVDRAIQRELRTLEQLLAGDGLVRRMRAAHVRDRLVGLLAVHAAGERLLLEAFARREGAAAASDMAAGYARALSAGPTRPHPHVVVDGTLSGLTYGLSRLRDRTLDVLDSRHSPLPRVPRPRRAPGRWGHYVLGTPLDGIAGADQGDVGRPPAS